MIPCSSPLAQYEAQRAEIDAAIARVLASGRYILGEEVERFEEEFAAYVGTSHAVGVGSGTEALHLALRAAGIGPGDEVVTVGHTAVATVAAIEMAGATPVLVDIDAATFTMDPSRVEDALTSRTRALVPVHLYGQPADLGPLCELASRRGLLLLEDCAQAHGASYGGRRVGSWGAAACFSFYPTKNLGALGDGGAVVTRDRALAERVKLLREYGWAERYVSHTPGLNSRLDSLQAAVLRVKLKALDTANAERARLASVYDAALAGADVTIPARGAGSTHVFHLYVVRSAARDALLRHLGAREIGAMIHYPVAVHRQPAYRRLARAGDELARTERAAAEVLSLPLYPGLKEGEQARVIDAVRSFPGEKR